MKNFNRKQKIIIICICIVLIGAIIYYVYANYDVNQGEEVFLDGKIDNQENVLNNALEEKNEDGKEKTKDVTVYITGAVNTPGVYILSEGSRIADVIDKAGGLTDDADAGAVNLAYVIEDGMHIILPRKNEEEKSYITTESGLDVNNTTKKSDNSGNKMISSAKININIATKEQLETLTGIGPSTADKIIEYRKENGNFKNVEDIKNVNGIGESKYSKIKDKICVK